MDWPPQKGHLRGKPAQQCTKACCTLSSLYRAHVSNFEARKLMVVKRKGGGIRSYVRKHQLPVFLF